MHNKISKLISVVKKEISNLYRTIQEMGYTSPWHILVTLFRSFIMGDMKKVSNSGKHKTKIQPLNTKCQPHRH